MCKQGRAVPTEGSDGEGGRGGHEDQPRSKEGFKGPRWQVAEARHRRDHVLLPRKERPLLGGGKCLFVLSPYQIE